jgi:DNA-directed RNA polymerase subunit H (RpoH/RPB5)
MALTGDDIYKLFITKRTQVEMLLDRGNEIPTDEKEMFIDNPDAARPTPRLLADFVARYTPTDTGRFSRQELSQTYLHTDDDARTHVYFAPFTIKDKQGISVVNSFIETITDIGATIGIIITNEGFTPDSKKALEAITQPIIQIFYDEEIYANPTRKLIVPKHEKISDEARRKFFQESGLQPRQALDLSIDDPIVRYYGWNIGDVIRVERVNLATSKTMSQTSIAYRKVSRIKFEAAKKVVKSS